MLGGQQRHRNPFSVHWLPRAHELLVADLALGCCTPLQMASDQMNGEKETAEVIKRWWK